MSLDKNTEADSVARIAREGVLPIFGIHTGMAPNVAHVIFPQTQRVESLERLLEAPVRKRADVTLYDYISFTTYVDLHKEPGTIIYAHIGANGGTFTAILDGHLFGQGQGNARWGDHVCTFVCQHSEEWKRWMAGSGKAMSQIDMAQFIEDNMIDIVDPEAARMLEVVKTLEASQGANFKSLVRLENGDRGLTFERNTTAKAGANGEMEIPSKLAINIPVFEYGPQYKVECRFRYNINDGALRMGYEVVRPHKIVELALIEAKNAITEAVAPMPVLFGGAKIPAI